MDSLPQIIYESCSVSTENIARMYFWLSVINYMALATLGRQHKSKKNEVKYM